MGLGFLKQISPEKDFFPGHPSANFYNPLSLRLPLPHQSGFILVGHVLFDLQGLSIMFF
jgi:hypothetical protein